MVVANLLNWTIGGAFMRAMGVMNRPSAQILLPSPAREPLLGVRAGTPLRRLVVALRFGVPLPVPAPDISLLHPSSLTSRRPLEDTARPAFSATGGRPPSLVNRPLALGLMVLSVAVVIVVSRRKQEAVP